MNPFLEDIDAQQYDAARPFIHPTVLARLAPALGGQFAAALDVACGTGQSTEALAALSSSVVGLDASAEMLRHARHRESIRYVRGRAEQLPFRNGYFDIVTVGLGLHWFDRNVFLREANRVLKRGAWLVVYDSGFCGRMKGNPAFEDWVAAYRQRFPAPPRDDEPMAPEVLARFGFSPVLSDRFVHREEYDLAQLVDYLTTQSNVRVAVREEGGAAGMWLRDTLRPLFPVERATFEYEAWSLLVQKAG